MSNLSVGLFVITEHGELELLRFRSVRRIL